MMVSGISALKTLWKMETNLSNQIKKIIFFDLVVTMF